MNAFYWFFTMIIFSSAIYTLYKAGWYPKTYSPWKIFGSIISLCSIFGICWLISVLVVNRIPPKSERLFKKIISNQIANDTKSEVDSLEQMVKSFGTTTLSKSDLELAQKNRLDAAKKRKNLEAMLKEPEEKTSSKPIPAKPKEEWDWVFKW
mgnify:FL=1